MRYEDRADAGRRIAPGVAAVVAERHERRGVPLILGVPRGGVVVADPIARALSGELDLALARKIGAPNNPELAIGAIGETGEPVLDNQLIARLGISADYLESAITQERVELQRRAAKYRGDTVPVSAAGRVVVVVDDGIATGATLQATLNAIRRQDPAVLICAVPVGAPEAVERIASDVDELVCPLRPRWFRAVGEWYDSFGQTSDADVVAILESIRSEGSA